ncbi:TetR/AcrR family transcriptional regulator [bacterium D16-50]|jgi:TetR/AcrR family transcriptional regulator|nr:TetR/AcrR family transcriptional regulator [bacterium D16-50]
MWYDVPKGAVFMNSKFFDLKKEKQDRIINAALKVFALQGYRHGSTDDIVREAGISKGLLFHYFESKLGVYRFIYDYSVRYMNLELRSTVSPKEKDLFGVMKQVECARMHAMKGYPYMQQFLNRSLAEDSYEALLSVEEKKNSLEETYAVIDSQIDYGLLPSGIDGEKLRKMLDFTVKGLMTERFQDASFQPDMLYQEICGYLDMMGQLVYRQ